MSLLPCREIRRHREDGRTSFELAVIASPPFAAQVDFSAEDAPVSYTHLYIALHVHAAIEDQKVSQAMQLTRAVRDCISLDVYKRQVRGYLRG